MQHTPYLYGSILSFLIAFGIFARLAGLSLGTTATVAVAIAAFIAGIGLLLYHLHEVEDKNYERNR